MRFCVHTIFFRLILRRVVARDACVSIHHRRRFPFVLLGPTERQVLHHSRLSQRGESIESLDENLALLLGFVWFPGGVTERKIKKRGAGRMHGHENINRAAHAQGGNSSSFNLAGDQSHGLMTDWSYRHQQSEVSLLRQESLDELRSQLLGDTPVRIDSAHEGKCIGSERTENAFLHQTP